MKPRVYFGSPLRGSLVNAELDNDSVTFELLESSHEETGPGQVEFWGYRINESYMQHHVEETTVVAINEEPYDISLHGSIEKFLSAFDFKIEACV